jgi:uncharacterized protein (DUF952 family)
MASVYKILTQPQWEQFKAEGFLRGSPIDLRDGFIHLSRQEQVEGVIARYYVGQRPLYVAEFPLGVFGASLRWEMAASTSEQFPHLYGRPLVFKEMTAFRVV